MYEKKQAGVRPHEAFSESPLVRRRTPCCGDHDRVVTVTSMPAEGVVGPMDEAQRSKAERRCDACLDRSEPLALLNGVLEDVRAEARMSSEVETLDEHGQHRPLFRHLRSEQMRSILLLLREIERLNGDPSLQTGPLGDRPPATTALALHLRSFADRQRQFHDRLDQALPRIAEGRLREVLCDLQQRHAQCVERCTALTDTREERDDRESRRLAGGPRNTGDTCRCVGP